MTELSDEYIRLNTPLSDEEFAAEMAVLEAQPYDDSGDLPPLNLNVPEITVTAQDSETPPRTLDGVGDHAADIGYGAATGVINAGTEIGHTFANAIDLVRDPFVDEESQGQASRGADKLMPRLGEEDFNVVGLKKPVSFAGNATQVVTQFMTAFIPANKAVQGVKAIQSVSRMAQTIKTAVGAGTAGAVADLSAFNPYEKRLSDMAKESGIPWLDNSITQYLSADEDDPELLARVKQASEGFLFSKVLSPLLMLIQATKRAKTLFAKENGIAKVAKEAPDNVAPVLDEVADEVVDGAVGDAKRFSLDQPSVTVPAEDLQKEYAHAYLDGDLEGAASRASEFINLKNLDTEEGVRDLIAAFAEKREVIVGKHRRTWGEAAANAGKMGAREVAEGAARVEGLDSFIINAGEVRAAVAFKTRELANIAKANPTKENVAIFEDAYRKLGVVHALVEGTNPEVARALNAMKYNISNKAVADKLLSVSTAGTTNMAKIAEMVADLPTSKSIVDMLDAASKPNWQDAVIDVYTNALFAPTTGMVNIQSTALSVLAAVPERYLGAIRSTLVGSQELTIREANEYALGMVTGIADGVFAFGKAWKTNAAVLGNETRFLESSTQRGFQGASFGIDDKSGAMIQAIGKGLDYIGIAQRSLPGNTRSLLASDEFFKGMAYKAEIGALAQRTARQAGLKKGTPAYQSKIEEVLQGAKDAKPGTPYYGVRMGAEESAHRLTFTEPLGEGGKKLMEGLRHGATGILTIPVLPFIKTVVNLVKYVGRRTPGLAGQSEYMLGELAAGGARKDLVEAQISGASMFLTAGMVLSSTGYLRGALTENYRAKANLTDLGVEQQAIVNPETGGQLPIGRLDGNPISFLLLAATFQETAAAYINENAEELEDEELVDGVMEMLAIPIAVGSKYMADKSWVAGVSQLFDSIKNDTTGEFAKKVVGNLLPAGGTLKWAKGQLPNELGGDPFYREAETALDEMRQKIPGMSRTLPPKPDILGNPRQPAENNLFGTNPVTPSTPLDHPIANELRRLQLENPDTTILGGVPKALSNGVKLDGVEKWNLMQFASKLKDNEGNDLVDTLGLVIGSKDYGSLTDTQRNNQLTRVFNSRIKIAKLALEADSQAFEAGLPRPFAEEFSLYDYIRKIPIGNKVATKEYSKLEGEFGTLPMSRDSFVSGKQEAVLGSGLMESLQQQQ
jgi:hypothetical protein|tara:strand:- start:1456 stop:5031 length:3576 start_codon:yes stop_codon:yes gene_type:complete